MSIPSLPLSGNANPVAADFRIEEEAERKLAQMEEPRFIDDGNPNVREGD